MRSATSAQRPPAPAPAAAPAGVYSTAMPTSAAPAAPAEPAPSATTLEEMELRTIQRAVDEAGGNISVASRRLGISRNTIYRKLRWRAPEDR